MLPQTSIGRILPTADILNFRGKAHIPVFNRAMFRRDNFRDSLNPAQDSVLHPDSRIIRDQGRSVRRRNVLPLSSRGIL